MNKEHIENNNFYDRYTDENKEVIYKNIPSTKNFIIKGYSDIEWDLPVPDLTPRIVNENDKPEIYKIWNIPSNQDDQEKLDNSPFIEKSAKGNSKFSKEGRLLALQTWNVIVAASGGEDADEKIILQNLRKLVDMDLYPEEYAKLLNRSFKSRIAWNRRRNEVTDIPQHVEEKHEIIIQNESKVQEVLNNKENMLNSLRNKYKEVEVKIKTISSSFKEKVSKPNLNINSVVNITLVFSLISGAIAQIRNSKIDLSDFEKNDPKLHETTFGSIDKILTEAPNDFSQNPEGTLLNKQTTQETITIPASTETSIPVLPYKNAVVFENKPANTPEPVSPYLFHGIDFSNTNPITLSFEIPKTVQRQNNNLPVLQPLTSSPILYEDAFTENETVTFGQETAPGTGHVWTDVDEYGNIIVGCHSGYLESTPLECEGLRQFLQGGNAENPAEQLSQDNIQERIEILNISRMEMADTQGNKITGTPMVGYIPPEMTEELYNDTKDMLEAVILATGGEKSPFAIYRQGNGVGLFFCAWGKPGEEKWWSKGAWVIFFSTDNSINNKNFVQSK